MGGVLLLLLDLPYSLGTAGSTFFDAISQFGPEKAQLQGSFGLVCTHVSSDLLVLVPKGVGPGWPDHDLYQLLSGVAFLYLSLYDTQVQMV